MQQTVRGSNLKDSLPSIEKTRNLANDILSEYFKDRINVAAAIDANYAGFWRTIQKAAMAGGKRLRPYLVLLSYNAFGGNDYETIMPIAAAQELLHQALLIHDDFIDQDTVRHGHPNIIGSMQKVYSAHTKNYFHISENAALLAGDLLLSGAYQFVIQSGVTDNLKIQLMRFIGDAISAVGAGEFIDMESSIRTLDEIDILKVAKLKTASYSFIAPLLSGATLAHANDATLGTLRDFGEKLGLAYQFQDDIFGIFSEEKITGKSIVSDIREGKPTLLIQLTLKSASAEQQKIIEKGYGNFEVTAHEIEEIKSIIKSSGAFADTEKYVNDYLTEAKTIIQNLGLSDIMNEHFYNLIDMVAGREN